MSVGIDAEIPDSMKHDEYGLEALDEEMRERNDIEQTGDRKNLYNEAKNLVPTLCSLNGDARNLRRDEIDNFERAKYECTEEKTFSLEELNRVTADSETEDFRSALDYLSTCVENTIGALIGYIRLINREKETSHGE